MDLSNVSARRELFGQLGDKANKVLIITEGFIIYLTPEEVGLLAQDLAHPRSFQSWILDLASPGLLRMLQKNMGAQLSQAGSALQFGPSEGPEFFARYGWKTAAVRSLLKTAARLKRLPLWMRMLAILPESAGSQGSRPWSGVCLFAKQ